MQALHALPSPRSDPWHDMVFNTAILQQAMDRLLRNNPPAVMPTRIAVPIVQPVAFWADEIGNTADPRMHYRIEDVRWGIDNTFTITTTTTETNTADAPPTIRRR